MRQKTYRNFLYFNIDRHLNPYIPHNRLDRLPTWISHWLGHRGDASHSPEPNVFIQWLFMIIGTVAGLCVVSSAYVYAPGLNKYNPPVTIASLGASAVLEYNAIRSPLAQPRNLIFGHGFATIAGVAVSKLFQLNSSFDRITWVAGAVGCACASLVMSITDTVHPPGGATALLASTEPAIVALGWMFVPFVLVGTSLMLVVALLVNNVARQFPTHWWTSTECGSQLSNPTKGKGERGRREGPKRPKSQDGRVEDVEKAHSFADSEHTLRHSDGAMESTCGTQNICITPNRIQIPAGYTLFPGEIEALEAIRSRLLAAGELSGLEMKSQEHVQ